MKFGNSCIPCAINQSLRFSSTTGSGLVDVRSAPLLRQAPGPCLRGPCVSPRCTSATRGSAPAVAVLHFLIHTENLLQAGLPIRTCFFPKNMWATWPAKSPRN